MIRIVLLIAFAVAQLSPPNKSGVAMGHLHYHVRDVEANRKFWIALGGKPASPDAKSGAAQVLKFPGALVFLSQGQSSGNTEGSVVNHVAFRVQSLAKVEAAGIKVERNEQYVGVASVFTPEGERIELFDETSENLKFTLDEGQNDPGAQRHNQRLTLPITAHHIHLYVPEGSELQAKAWYLRMFGGVPGKRWRYEAVDLPGINLNFSGSPRALPPIKGRMLDHIGFEIRNLEAFCRKLEANGVKFDASYSKNSSGVGTAFLTDPWGTYIELTEGLSGL